MSAVMHTSTILSADPDELVDKRRAMTLLGITRAPVWRELVQAGELAIFQRAAGPKPDLVLMSALQDYVRRTQARAEDERRKRFRAAQRGRKTA